MIVSSVSCVVHVNEYVVGHQFQALHSSRLLMRVVNNRGNIYSIKFELLI
jgi:uncharacterized protein (DUF779 family)